MRGVSDHSVSLFDQAKEQLLGPLAEKGQAAGAQESASASEELSAQSQEMKRMAWNLAGLLGGEVNRHLSSPGEALRSA